MDLPGFSDSGRQAGCNWLLDVDEDLNMDLGSMDLGFGSAGCTCAAMDLGMCDNEDSLMKGATAAVSIGKTRSAKIPFRVKRQHGDGILHKRKKERANPMSHLMTAVVLTGWLAGLTEPIVFELFAGMGGFTAAVNSNPSFPGRAYGFEWSKMQGQDEEDLIFVDLTDMFIVETLLRFLCTSLLVRALGAGVCCATFSTARRGKPRTAQKRRAFPLQLRSKAEPWGMDASKFTARELLTLQQGSACLRTVLQLFKAAIPRGIKAWVENPLRSYLWHVPEVVQLIQTQHGIVVPFSQCAFGSLYRKDTKIAFFNVDDSKLMALQAPGLCKSRQKLCCFTGRSHKRTCPSEMEPNMFKHGFESQAAGHYPECLCKELANALL